jgi:hypothetical protein
MSEVEETTTVEVSAVEELINKISDGELNNAEGSFHNIIQDKMADALEAQRIATAKAIFNDDEDDDIEDIEDIDDDESDIEDIDDDEEEEDVN